MKTWVFVFLFIFVSTHIISAEPQTAASGVSGKLSSLIFKLDELEKKQEEILKRQNELIEEIKNLKIRVRR